MNERDEKLKEIFSDEKLVKEVFAIEAPEDARDWFEEHGVELSLDEIRAMGEAIKKAANGEELGEDDLEDVTGGSLTAIAIVAGGIAIAGIIKCLW